MRALKLKLTHKRVQSFYGALRQFENLGFSHENALNSAFHGRVWLVPFGAANLRLPDWEEDLRRRHEEHQMPALSGVQMKAVGTDNACGLLTAA